MSTTQSETLETFDEIREIVDVLSDNMNQPLDAAATHAVQIVGLESHVPCVKDTDCSQLFWKKIESSYNQGHFSHAESWCRLALHGVFAKSGTSNAAKIARFASNCGDESQRLIGIRKMILCALERHDTAAAREIFGQMSADAKVAPVTQYLMFKVALRSGERDFGKQTSFQEAREST